MVEGKPWLFQPGNTWRGNPGGAPRRADALASRIRELGARPYENDETRTYVDAMLATAWAQACNGNDDARTFLANRGWGKVPDKLELGGPDDFAQLSPDEQTRALVELVEQAQAVIAQRLLVLPAPEKGEEDVER